MTSDTGTNKYKQLQSHRNIAMRKRGREKKLFGHDGYCEQLTMTFSSMDEKGNNIRKP
jgi:hypothetical protein